MFQDRPYQAEMKQRIYSAWDSGIRNICAVLPTGAGKTHIVSGIMAQNAGPSVAIAHRQELVSQISLALGREGVTHKIIGPAKVVKQCVQIHMMELGRSWYDCNAPVAVAGVDTMIRRQEQLQQWAQSVTLMVQDECFPAGTMVDGRPIETIKPGDMVISFCDQTGEVTQKRVVRTYKNPKPNYMVRLKTEHHTVECTGNHPIFTAEGWKNAETITADDVLFMVRDRISTDKSTVSPIRGDGETVLQQGMFREIPFQNVRGNNGKNKSEICKRTDEETKSYETSGNTAEGQPNTEGTRTQAKDTGGQRETATESGSETPGTVRSVGVYRSDSDTDGKSSPTIQVPAIVQSGCGKQGIEDSTRSGWGKSSPVIQAGTGQNKGCSLVPVGVDSVTVHQSGNNGGNGQCDMDRYVYNLEVEDNHTYFANGIAVHNCHHILTENKWGTAAEMFPAARLLGVTATPCRADGKGLGKHVDGLLERLIVGPTMRELIDQGFLSEYIIYAPPSDLDLSGVKVGASGDYSKPGLSKAVHKSHIVGDVVEHYQRLAAGKLGITFATDVESATEIAAAYNTAGVPAEIVSAKTPDLVRAQVLRRFRDREILQLVNVDLFGEGFDLPAIEVCSMARPTQSYALYVQQFGRALRPLPGKSAAIIIDHVGNVMRHKLPDVARNWTLDRRDKRQRAAADDAIPVRTCDQCAGVYERIHTVCPYCGTQWEPARRSAPEFVDGDLEMLDAEALRRMWSDVEAVDRSQAEIRAECAAKYMPELGIRAAMKRHRERKEAQAELRAVMQQWGGYRTAEGLDTPTAQRMFWHRFGIDVLTAQTLGAKDAGDLMERVRNDQ